MHPKDLVTHFQKIVIVYYAMAYYFGDISKNYSKNNSKNFVKFLQTQHLF